MSEEHGTKHILQSLVVNVAIVVAKGIAAALTGSGAMLAETLHSAADCGNQVQQGPGEVMVSLKVRCRAELTTAEIVKSLNEFEAELHRKRPEVRWIFVEPDFDD